MPRDIWYIKNLTNKQLGISDLPKLQTLGASSQINLLDYHTKEQILQSKNLLTLLNNNWVQITKIEDGTYTTVTSDNAENEMTLADVADTPSGATGSFLSQDGKTIQVNNGIITSISE